MTNGLDKKLPEFALGSDVGNRAAIPGAMAQALLVSPQMEDWIVLKRIFRQQGWKLMTAATLESAAQFLRDHPIPVVISERDLPAGSWKDLLYHLQDLPHAPLLVVMSRHADELLWSEVLNLCGHDVLIKPLRPSEAVRVFRHAFQRWHYTRPLQQSATK